MPLVAILAFSVLFYTYAGYPLLIALCARLRPHEVREDGTFLPRVTACVPLHDVERYVVAKVESLLALDYPADRLEILLYSDASTDGTDLLAEVFAKRDARIRFERTPVRGGKPKAVNRMRELATGDVLLMTDARQCLDPGALKALVRKLADHEIGCVSGNLVLRGHAGSGAYWRYENWIRRNEAGFRGMVGVTGPIYAIRKSDMRPLPEDIVLDDVWVPMQVRFSGRRVAFAERAVAYDDAFSDGREYERKVRTLAGMFQLFAVLPRLLVPFANPSWFETVSHKLLRLLGPFALAALLIASSWAALDGDLTDPTMEAIAACQWVFYALAAFGAAAGRLGSLARTFVVLNAAAVAGFFRFVRGTQRVTW